MDDQLVAGLLQVGGDAPAHDAQSDKSHHHVVPWSSRTSFPVFWTNLAGFCYRTTGWCLLAGLHQPLIETDEVKGCLAGQRAATVLHRATQADVVRALSLCRVVR